MMPQVDFNQAPFIVIWETTRACDLACRHCRAEAQPEALPGELTLAEGLDLVDQVAAMGTPVLVFSGGDPLKRQDLPALIRHGKARGLRVGTIPAATPLLTQTVVQELKAAGLDQMALSLDAPTAMQHDRFRGVSGAFAQTMAAVEWAHAAGLPLQINTVISASNFAVLEEMIALVQRLGIVFWEVFFLVPMGRGAQMAGLTPAQYEAAFARLWALERSASFLLKVTEGLHYRRFCLEQHAAGAGPRPEQPVRRASAGGPAPQMRAAITRASQTVNAGRGHCFVAFNGDIYPSGFLPVAAGNIRSVRLVTVYQEAPLFRALRDAARLKGRCGVCEYREVCGGSRARAFAVTGDYLAEEPCCAYVPQAGLSPLHDPRHSGEGPGRLSFSP